MLRRVVYPYLFQNERKYREVPPLPATPEQITKKPVKLSKGLKKPLGTCQKD
jgi:hypothetical protein